MKINDAEKSIDEVLEKIKENLTIDGITVSVEKENETEADGALSAIIGNASIKADADSEGTELCITVAACVEENGEVDDEMLNAELNKALLTANDYRARLLSCIDKATTVKEIENMLNTGVDAAEDRRAAYDRARFYKIASIVAAGLLVASALWLLIDMIIK